MTTSTTEPRVDSASLVIAASPHAIYSAFIDGSAWERWLPPEGMTGRIEKFEARPGGRYKMALTYRGEHANRGKSSDDTDVVEGRFVDLVTDVKVVHAVTFQSDDPAFAGEIRMTWGLEPVPEGTKVSIICENVPVGISKEDHDIGLRSTLANLAKFLA
ncbi:SRPBCC domain-containing protein [Mesorhizobium sp. B2-4-6]|uniref:SRPBCC domain-containing protein n=1 Tax=Mesorhizobium sp. B2-4-6 TaxID=2589943 RepID=UPI00112B04DC|nr:SRPBCC domain-containing protein [Mesorhizobium sp. B2-4-6]TPL46396.1 ATPase [Mesorhizobium sp. B2-4-6]